MTAPELLPVTTTEVAEYSETAAGLAELRQQLEGHVFDCSTTAGDKEARQSRMALVKLRTSLEARRKELKAPLLDRTRLIDDEAKRITGEILKLEQPIDDAIRAQEQRREEARAEAERIERERVTRNEGIVTGITNTPLRAVNQPTDAVRRIRDGLRALLPDVDDDYAEKADDARTEALVALDQILEAAEAMEARQAELAAEREALEARQRADAAAAAEREAAERAERQAREAEEQAERDRVAAEQAERQRQLDEQEAALRAQQEAAEAAEAARRAEVAREEAERQEALRLEREAAARLQAEKDAARAAEQEAEAIRTATLVEAAQEAHQVLCELGYANHITTRKLAAAIERHTQRRQKREAKP